MAESYSCQDIQVLRGLEVVRRRPGMYVGNTDDGTGYEHMIAWLMDDGVEQHRKGGGTYVRVAHVGNAIVYEHDGAGYAAEELELACTVLHGMLSGLPIATALSSELEAITYRDGRAHRMRFARGEVVSAVEDVGPSVRTGLRLRFIPDETIFGPRGPSHVRLRRRLRLLTAANPGLTLLYNDRAFRAPDGAADFARFLARGSSRRHDEPIRLTGELDEIGVDIALLWTDRPAPRLVATVNGKRCPRGSHVKGLLAGIQEGFARVDGAIARAYPAAFREVAFPGLVMVVNVTLEHPHLCDSMRENLEEPDVRRLVRTVVARGLAAHLQSDAVLRQELLARFPRGT